MLIMSMRLLENMESYNTILIGQGKTMSEKIVLLGELAISIEHVGSTSVKGLAAKPIIDIDVLF